MTQLMMVSPSFNRERVLHLVMMMKTVCRLFFLFCITPTISVANWYNLNDGPDVFGEKQSVLTSEFQRGSDSMRFECDSAGNYSLNWLIRMSPPPESVRDLIGHVLVKADTGEPRSVKVRLQSWNEKYVALSANNDPVVLEVVKDIMAAYSKIDFGYVLPEIDSKVSNFTSASRSTSGAKGFLAHCGL